MKRLALLAVVTALAGFGVARAQGQPAKEAQFVSAKPADFKEVIPGVSRATLWGDPNAGAYGALTKFVPGFDAGVHTHTNDLRIVVVRGAYLYRTDGKETRVGSGDFLFIPGGTKHWSGGDPKKGALFFQEGLGKFDLVPAK